MSAIGNRTGGWLPRVGPGLLAAGLVWALSAPGAAAQQRPLRTEDPRLVPDGVLVVESGVGFFREARFPVSGLSGDLLSVGRSGVHVGLGRAEFQVWGTLRNILWIDSGGTGRTSDWGDASLATKFSILTEGPRRPDVSFQTVVVLPNASNESGLGKDGTDFVGHILAGKTLGPAYVWGRVGLGILDDAQSAGSQEDVLTWGLAGAVPVAREWSVLGEIGGVFNPRDDPSAGGETRAEARLGARWRRWGMDWDVAATAGMTEVDHRVGMVAGGTARFDLW